MSNQEAKFIYTMEGIQAAKIAGGKQHIAGLNEDLENETYKRLFREVQKLCYHWNLEKEILDRDYSQDADVMSQVFSQCTDDLSSLLYEFSLTKNDERKENLWENNVESSAG